jgi:Tfp pilus assembly protein PilO
MFLVVAIFAAGWFLLIAPKRSEASDLQAQAASQDNANAKLQDQVQMLMAQQAELPQQRAKLAVLRKQIPDNPALPTLIRNLTAAGRKTGVTIDSLAPTLPVPVVTSAQPIVATTTTEDSAAAASESDTEAAPAVVAAPPAPTLYQVPLKVVLVGSYFELEQFVNRLEGLRRSFQVTGFTVEPAATEGTTEGTGDLQLALDGRVFISPPASTTTTPTTPVASAPAAQ